MLELENNLDIDSIRKLRSLNGDEVLQVVAGCQNSRKGKKTDIIDKDCLHFVWSIYNNEEFDQRQDQYVLEKFGQAKTIIINNLGYEFLCCLYNLDVSYYELGKSWKENITEHIEIRCDSGVIEYEFYSHRKPIHFNFLMWLCNRNYFDHSDPEIKSPDAQIKFDAFAKIQN